MIELNLKTQTKEQELIKKYLQENASQTLADKINNGVPYTKDNKQLINKKDLNGFMQYACEEAKKQAEKGVSSTCIEDKVVYGWAIHYFEENSIVGTLFDSNGEEYKEKVEAPKVQQTPKPVKKDNAQYSMFNLDSFEDEKVEEQPPVKLDNYTIDTNTGEVLNHEPTGDELSSSFDMAIAFKLCELLDNKLDMN